MHTPPILVGANLEVGVMSLIRRILEQCNWRLIISEGGCAVNNEDELLPILTSLLTMIEMAVTGLGQELSLVSLSRVMRTTTISAKIRALLTKAWEIRL